jgi:hypothetical protein
MGVRDILNKCPLHLFKCSDQPHSLLIAPNNCAEKSDPGFSETISQLSLAYSCLLLPSLASCEYFLAKLPGMLSGSAYQRT